MRTFRTGRRWKPLAWVAGVLALVDLLGWGASSWTTWAARGHGGVTRSADVLAAEVVEPLGTGSLALLADAGHMLTDAAGLSLALVAAHLITRRATDRRT